MIFAALDKNAPLDLTPLFQAFSHEMGITEDYAVEVIFVGERRIRSVNLAMRGVDKVTDVLSFPALTAQEGVLPTAQQYPLDVVEGRLFIGSIMVCTARAKAQAKRFGHSEQRELNYLVCHGLLHLLGYDHMQEEEKARMRQKEEAVLSKMGVVR